MSTKHAFCSLQTVALGHSTDAPQEWVIASAEVRPYLDPQVAWIAEASELDPLLRSPELRDAEQLLIACHGSSDGLALGGGLSTDALKTQVSQRRQSYALPISTPVQLWACHAGGADGPAAALQEALGNPVLASPSTLGRGKGLVGVRETATTKILQELPINLHTNSVGFDIVDNLNGTYALSFYYGGWSSHENVTTREGGLALYTLKSGDSADYSNYLDKAYGKGASLGDNVFPFQNPPRNTDSINIPLSYFGVQKYYGHSSSDSLPGSVIPVSSLGFVAGKNYFFSNKDQLLGYNYSGSEYVGSNNGTSSHQSAYIPSILPGTYRAGYDCDPDGNDNCLPVEYDSPKPSDPDEVGRITSIFQPEAAINTALITITGSGELIFGDAPKVLIDSVDLDNGYSPTDFITSTRTVKISGSYAESSGVDPNTIKVTFNGRSYTTSDDELTASNGAWTLDFGDQQFEQRQYTIDAIVGGDTSTKVSQELDIVNVSVQSIDRDDGEDPNDFITSDQNLVIKGIYDSDRFKALEIGLKNQDGDEIVAGRGTSETLGDVWTLDLTDQVLAEGKYSINITATDENGATYGNSQSLEIVDIPQPLVVTAVDGDTSLLATSNTAQISGTYRPSDFTDGNTVGQLTINGVVYRTDGDIQLNSANGTWTLTPEALPYGALDVRSEIETSQHYNTADYQIIIVDKNSPEAKDPNPPEITQIANNEGNFEDVNGNDSIMTKAFDLELKGTYRPEDARVSLTVEFDGNTYKLGDDKELTAIGDEWTFKLPNAKSGSLTVQNTNVYGLSTSTSSNITIAVPAPKVPTFETIASADGEEVPIVAGAVASATNTKLVLTGGYESLRSVGGFELTYEGKTYVLEDDSELTNFGDTWTFVLENPTSDLDGSAVQVKATSASGEFSTADASVALTLPDPTQPQLVDIDGANVTDLDELDADFDGVDYLVDGDDLIITGSFDPANAAGGLAVSFVAQPETGEITESTQATIYTLDGSEELAVDPDNGNQWILTLPAQTGVLKSATVTNGNGVEATTEFSKKILELELDAFDYSQEDGEGSGSEKTGVAMQGTPTDNYPNQLLFDEGEGRYFLFATSSKQDNWLKGEKGDDEMLSNGGADTLHGGAGRDQFTVSEETAEVDGGDGADRFEHQGAAFSLHTLDMGAGRDRLVNTGMLLMAEKNGQERVLQMGAGNDQLTTNTYIDVDVLDGGGGQDALLLTDDFEMMGDDLANQKSAFKSHLNYKGQGFEITGFESIRQDSGTWNYQGDFKSSDLVIAGGIANFELTEPVSVLRAKRVRFKAEGDDSTTLHFDVSQLLGDDLIANDPIRFRIRRLANAKKFNPDELNLTLSASKTGPPSTPDKIFVDEDYVRWDLYDPNPKPSESMLAESDEHHSMAGMSAIEAEPDQSIYLGRKGKNLILTTTDIFSELALNP